MHPAVKAPPLLLLFIGVPCVLTAGALAVFASCSGSSSAPTGATLPDGAPAIVANPDAPPGPSCTPIDIAAGTGKKFCELPGTDSTALKVPPEFCVREFTTTPVVEARVLRFAPNGDLFVAAPSMDTPGGATDGPGAIVVLPDDDGDGRADAVLTYAGPTPRKGSTCALLDKDPSSFACVHGLLFTGGYLYFTRSNEVRRFPYTPGQRTAPPATSELVAMLGGENIEDARWTHTLELTKSGSIYVSRGRTDTSGCSAEQMARGAVFALHVEANGPLPLTPEIVADGFRNPMYLPLLADQLRRVLRERAHRRQLGRRRRAREARAARPEGRELGLPLLRRSRPRRAGRHHRDELHGRRPRARLHPAPRHPLRPRLRSRRLSGPVQARALHRAPRRPDLVRRHRQSSS